MRSRQKCMVAVLSVIVSWITLSCAFMTPVEAPSETAINDFLQQKTVEREKFSAWTESYRSEDPQLHFPTGHSRAITSMDFSPDGKFLVTGSRDTTLKLWELKTGRVLRTFRGHE